jgi:hypothetical protein
VLGTTAHGLAQIEGAQADLDNLNPTSSLSDCSDYSDYSGDGVGQSEAEADGESWWSGGVQRHGCRLQAGLGCGEGDEGAEKRLRQPIEWNQQGPWWSGLACTWKVRLCAVLYDDVRVDAESVMALS